MTWQPIETAPRRGQRGPLGRLQECPASDADIAREYDASGDCTDLYADADITDDPDDIVWARGLSDADLASHEAWQRFYVQDGLTNSASKLRCLHAEQARRRQVDMTGRNRRPHGPIEGTRVAP